MRFRILLVLLLCTALPLIAQSTDPVEADLAALKGKIVTLRHFYAGSGLHYDADGNLLGQSESGPWTLTGRMRIDEVSVKQDQVQLEGSRIWVSFKDGSQINGITRNLLSLKIDLSQGSDRIERWRHALPNVLFTNGTSLSADAPEYWRKFLGPPSSEVPQSGPPSGITRVRINQGVSEAMILRKEQPKYPPEALAAHQQGKVVFETVIGKDGHIKYLQIAVPAGLGMDDAAAKAVLQWVYRPFYLKGIPVEVDTQIIVNFALK